MEIETNFSDKAKRDNILISKAKRGNGQAYAELLGYYKDALYFTMFKMVNNKSDADDLTIEAFAKAFSSLNSYSETFAFSTWLFRIATNNCIDFLRRKRNTIKGISIDDDNIKNGMSPAMFVRAASPSPEEHLITKQKEDILKKIISKLPPDYRRVVLLRYYDELSYNEIAEKLEIPLGTVKARIHRSRELLFTILKNKEGIKPH